MKTANFIYSPTDLSRTDWPAPSSLQTLPTRFMPVELVAFQGAKVVVLAREDGTLTYGMSLSPGTRRIHCVASGLK